MPIDDVVVAAEHCLKRSLEPIEKLILQASWEGQPYNLIAETSGYASVYVREVGARLWQALSDGLGTKVTKKTLSLVMEIAHQNKSPALDYPSGPLPTGSPLYVERLGLAQQAQAALVQPGSLIRIQGPSRMGKTSFLFRLLEQGRGLGYHIVNVQLRHAPRKSFASLEAFLQWFCFAIQTELGLKEIKSPAKAFQTLVFLGGKLQASLFLQQQILAHLNRPMVLALRNLDLLGEHPPLKTELLALLRSWHDDARSLTSWNKLRLALTYTNDFVLSTDSGNSPLTSGVEIRLEHFSAAESAQLAQRYGLSGQALEAVPPLFELLGGHPYLLAIAFYHLKHEAQTLGNLLETANSPSGIYGNHLRSYWGLLQGQPSLAKALRQIVLAKEPIQVDPLSAHRLQSMGLVKFQGHQVLPSCALYRQYFALQLPAMAIDVPPELSDRLTLEKLSKQVEVLQQQLEEVQQFNQLDRMSQLTSRQFFEQRVQQLCDRLNQEQAPLALLLCSFDHYDVYVKAYGYPQAEEALRQIANRLRESIEGPLENFARYGPEQFMVAIPHCPHDQARIYADRVRRGVEALNIPQSIDYMGWPSQVVTVSLGVAVKGAQTELAAAYLFATAERALGYAQRQGNNDINVQDCQLSEAES